jgi:hypothetical protein
MKRGGVGGSSLGLALSCHELFCRVVNATLYFHARRGKHRGVDTSSVNQSQELEVATTNDGRIEQIL